MWAKVIHRGHLAHWLTYPGYDKMSECLVWNAAEANTVIYGIENQLGRIHKHGVYVGKSTVRFFKFALKHGRLAEVYLQLTTIGTNPLMGMNA